MAKIYRVATIIVEGGNDFRQVAWENAQNKINLFQDIVKCLRAAKIGYLFSGNKESDEVQ